MSNLTGQNLGPYRILEQIGQGGMATVYKAYQASMDRYVAVKILPPHFMQDPTYVERFQREARTIARLEHPHILPVHDYGKADDGTTYITMRYIEAGTLADMLENSVLFLEDAYRIFIQIADALAYAHEQGVVHRDMKPSNVLIDLNNQPFLTDFGLARIMEGDSKLTGSMILGTPTYMAPEQGEGQPANERSDIYALGIILYEMTTGRPPFQAETPMAVMLKHLTEPLPLPRQLNPNIPETVQKVILKALAKEPNDRYQNVSDMISALRRAISQAPAVAPPPQAAPPEAAPLPSPAAKRPRWLWLAAGGIALLLIIGLLAIIFGEGEGEGGMATGSAATSVTQREGAIRESTAQAQPAQPQLSPAGDGSTTSDWTQFSNTSGVINAIAVQGDLVWAGTEGGLVAWNRRDGSHQKYTNQQGLAYHAISALLVAQDGSLWAGTSGEGVLHFDGQTWQVFGEEEGLTSNDIYALIEPGDGTLLAGTAYNPQLINHFDGSRWRAADLPPLPEDLPEPIALLPGEENTFIIGLDGGGFLYTEGEDWVQLTTANGLPSDTVYSIAVAPDDNLLLATDREAGTGFFDGETFTPIPELADTLGTAIYIAPDETVWVGTYGEGLWRFDGGTPTLHNDPDGLTSGPITTMVQDDDGLLWLGVEGIGLVRFDGQTFALWAVENEPPFNTVRQILETDDGRLWFVQLWGSDIIAIYDPNTDTWERFETPGSTQAVTFDLEGNLWLGTNEGLWRISATGARQRFSTADGLPGEDIIQLAFDADDNDLWVGTTTGLAFYNADEEEISWHDFSGFISAPYVKTLYIDDEGQVWIGTQSDEAHPAGITWANDGTIYDTWTVDTPFPRDLGGVEAFVAGQEGRLWVGTWDTLWRLDEREKGQWRQITPDDGAPDDAVLTMVIQSDGTVWFGTWYDGLWRFNDNEGWQQFWVDDGLPGQAVFASYVDSKGQLWVSTEAGIARYAK